MNLYGSVTSRYTPRTFFFVHQQPDGARKESHLPFPKVIQVSDAWNSSVFALRTHVVTGFSRTLNARRSAVSLS